MIPLMKSAFLNESDTKRELSEFIINSSKLSMGDKCEEFETEFAKYQGCKHAVLFNSGGSANLAMLQSLKNLGILTDGDKIGFSALTWSTNVMPIIQLGMIPVPIDVTLNTLNCMATNISERIQSENLAAIFITNALGFAGDLIEISRLCKEHGIILIEDNCEALGTELAHIKTGNFGVCSSVSFFVAHHMSTIEGGMVCTNDAELATMLKIVRANGWDRNLNSKIQAELRSEHNISSEFDAKYTFYDLGYNLRPTEITGFLGLCQLKLLNNNVKRRSEIYARLEQTALGNPDIIPMNHNHISTLSAFAFPMIFVDQHKRNVYMQKFNDVGIEIRPIIAGNIQNQPFYKKYVKCRYNLPNTEYVHNCGFYCGAYPDLTESDLCIIENCLRNL